MPAFAMLDPSFSSRWHSASSSFGVVNMHLMSCPAERIVIAWSMQCSWYAFRCSIQPFLMSLTTQRGSRSTQKQMPPRYWHRCSTASRSRRGPDGPSISQLRPLREELVRQRVGEHLVVDPEVVDDDAALGDAGGAAGLEDVPRLVLAAPSAPSGRTGPPRSQSSSKNGELLEVVEALDVLERVELERLGLLQPERRAGLRAEVPADDLADLGVELGAGVLDLLVERRAGDGRRLAGGVFHGVTRFGGVDTTIDSRSYGSPRTRVPWACCSTYLPHLMA